MTILSVSMYRLRASRRASSSSSGATINSGKVKELTSNASRSVQSMAGDKDDRGEKVQLFRLDSGRDHECPPVRDTRVRLLLRRNEADEVTPGIFSPIKKQGDPRS